MIDLTDAARRALKPFAKIADQYEASLQMKNKAAEYAPPLRDTHRVSISLGDCRRARLALSTPSASAGPQAEAVALRALFLDHYWDSLEDRKAIIMKHIDYVLSLAHPQPQQADGREAVIWMDISTAPKDRNIALLSVQPQEGGGYWISLHVGKWHEQKFSLGLDFNSGVGDACATHWCELDQLNFPLVAAHFQAPATE